MQESDYLEMMKKGEVDKDTEHVRLVSLGSYCGPKLSFQRIGRGAETLPFDWMRTTVDGLLHFMRNDFEGFYDFVTKMPVPGSDKMTMYRNFEHSFWHDDPRDPGMRERYGRRIKRFFEIDASSEPVLFVRAAGDSEELRRAPELLAELSGRFGAEARLLLLLPFQARTQGPALVSGHGKLLLDYLPGEIHRKGDHAPYAQCVQQGLHWAIGKDMEARRFGSIEEAFEATDATSWGHIGLGGLEAFERTPAAKASEATTQPRGQASPPSQDQLGVSREAVRQERQAAVTTMPAIVIHPQAAHHVRMLPAGYVVVPQASYYYAAPWAAHAAAPAANVVVKSF